MEESAIHQIGERLKGLREVLDLSVGELAETMGCTPGEYLKIESGESELHISNLQKIARKYQLSLDELLFGEEPHMSTYFVTRKGKGASVNRVKAYHYESLASGFRGRIADPFIVTVSPKPDGTPLNRSSHPNQEFDMVLEGTLEMTVGTKVIVLEEGDSIYFDSTQPHCMRALNGKPVRFFAIVF